MSKASLLAGASVAFAALGALTVGSASAETTLNIATVNNSDMIIMQKLSPKFEAATGIKLNWVVLEENVLRQRVTTDIATKGGQFDIITIGSYKAPIWGKLGWLDSVDDLGDAYDYGDLIPQVKAGLSADGKMYAVPFYAESSFTFYRKDLFEKAGITMPDKPTYEQIAEYAAKFTDKNAGQYGMCLRGKPGWGENMAFFDTLVNAYGGQWFDMKWNATLTSDAWKSSIKWYLDVMAKSGPPGATANGHNENRALFATGKCAIWIDATSAAGLHLQPEELAGGRQDRLHRVAGHRQEPRTRPAGHGLGRSAFPLPRKRRTRRRSSSPGRPRRTTSSWSATAKVGSPRLPARGFRPTPTPNIPRRRRSRRPC